MEASFDYMPVFRARTQEMGVLINFKFGNRICPYIELVRLKDRPRNMSSSLLYYSMIYGIKSDIVFVDIPVQLKLDAKSKKDVIEYLTPMRNIDTRNKTLIDIIRFGPLPKMVPVISSYYFITNKTGSIKKQVEALRSVFPRLAFRVTAKDPEYETELDQVEPYLTTSDHLIVDFEEDAINIENEHIKDLKNKLSTITVCPIIAMRSAIPNAIAYKELRDDEEVPGSDNRLLREYKSLGVSAFGDYAGIKKDLLQGGGGSNKIKYGCIFYDATNNQYYGYKGAQAGYDAIKDSLIPSVINSSPSQRMMESSLHYLCDDNRGWKLLHTDGTGRPGDMKRVSMEHYLYCIRTKVEAGNFI